MEILFPHDKFLNGKFLQNSPLSSTKKIPLKASVHFPIIITIYKYWSKFLQLAAPPTGTVGE